MPDSIGDTDKPKQSKTRKTTRKPAPARSVQKSTSETRPSASTAEKVPHTGGTATNAARTPQVVITEDEYRSLVAQKAYELYLQRCAVTEVDDWFQAERIVKEMLLAQGRAAGLA